LISVLSWTGWVILVVGCLLKPSKADLARPCHATAKFFAKIFRSTYTPAPKRLARAPLQLESLSKRLARAPLALQSLPKRLAWAPFPLESELLRISQETIAKSRQAAPPGSAGPQPTAGGGPAEL
jgi:hypothetical protein